MNETAASSSERPSEVGIHSRPEGESDEESGRMDSEDAVLYGKPKDVKSCLNVITSSQMSRDGFEPYKQLFDRLYRFIGSELEEISKPVQNAMLRSLVRYPKSAPTTWFDCLHFDCSKLGRSTSRLLKCFELYKVRNHHSTAVYDQSLFENVEQLLYGLAYERPDSLNNYFKNSHFFYRDAPAHLHNLNNKLEKLEIVRPQRLNDDNMGYTGQFEVVSHVMSNEKLTEEVKIVSPDQLGNVFLELYECVKEHIQDDMHARFMPILMDLDIEETTMGPRESGPGVAH